MPQSGGTHHVRIIARSVLTDREVTRSHISMRSNRSAPTKSEQDTSIRIAQNAPAKSGQNTSARSVRNIRQRVINTYPVKCGQSTPSTGDWVRRQIVLRALRRGTIQVVQGSLFAPHIQSAGFACFFRCFT